jgi:hypothetical protein
MKKTIIKCDVCGKIIDRDDPNEEGVYYHLSKQNLPGWTTADYDLEKADDSDICRKCFKNLHLPKHHD